MYSYSWKIKQKKKKFYTVMKKLAMKSLPYPSKALFHKELISQSIENKDNQVCHVDAIDYLVRTLLHLKSNHPTSITCHSHSHRCTNRWTNLLSRRLQTLSRPYYKIINFIKYIALITLIKQLSQVNYFRREFH